MNGQVVQGFELWLLAGLRFVWQDFSVVAAALVQILFPAAVCCLVIHFLRRFLMSRIAAAFGWHGVLAVSWLGTPIHELSHVAVIVLSGMRVAKLAIFEPNKETGGLGYVKFAYNPHNPLHQMACLICALAPVIGGSLAIYAATILLLPNFSLYHSLAGVPFFQPADVLNGQLAMQAFWRLYDYEAAILRQLLSAFSLSDWRTYVYIYFVFSVAHNMAPSAQDLVGFPRRMVFLFVVLLVLNTPLLLMGPAGSKFYGETILPPVLAVAASLTSILYLGVIVCVGAAVISYPLTGLVRVMRR